MSLVGLTNPALWRLGFILLLLLVGAGALAPVSIEAPLFPGHDKVIHALTYTLLFVAGWLAYGRGRPFCWPLHIALLAYGAGFELLQGMTGYRSAEWADLAANLAGLGLGNALIFAFLSRLRRNPEHGH